MRAPKIFEGGVHPPHISPPFFVLTTITGTKYAILSKIYKMKLTTEYMLSCYPGSAIIEELPFHNEYLEGLFQMRLSCLSQRKGL